MTRSSLITSIIGVFALFLVTAAAVFGGTTYYFNTKVSHAAFEVNVLNSKFLADNNLNSVKIDGTSKLQTSLSVKEQGSEKNNFEYEQQTAKEFTDSIDIRTNTVTSDTKSTITTINAELPGGKQTDKNEDSQKYTLEQYRQLQLPQSYWQYIIQKNLYRAEEEAIDGEVYWKYTILNTADERLTDYAIENLKQNITSSIGNDIDIKDLDVELSDDYKDVIILFISKKDFTLHTSKRIKTGEISAHIVYTDSQGTFELNSITQNDESESNYTYDFKNPPPSNLFKFMINYYR